VRFTGEQFIHVPPARFKPGFEVTGHHDGQRRQVGTLETLLCFLQCPDVLEQGIWPPSELVLLRRPAFTLSLHSGTVVGDKSLCEIAWQATHSDDIGDDVSGAPSGKRVGVDTDFGGDYGYSDQLRGGSVHIGYLSWCFILPWISRLSFRAERVEGQ
jgi:hypothetical protein